MLPAALLLLALPQEPALRFERVELSSEFLCEGATFADLDGDGDQDVIAGTLWWEGPDFAVRHEIDASAVFDPHAYSDRFFVWPHDFDGDGRLDVLLVGFPGQEAFWYRNPIRGESARDDPWPRSLVAPAVDNESPTFVDLVGDAAPELVFQSEGRFGWAAPDPADPSAPWTFHSICPQRDIGRFTHGLGVGDVDGDGRADVLWKEGWFAQPASLDGDPEWAFHPFSFSDREGGAQMYVTDVDGDGDGDVITSLAAHHFGLSWFENRGGGTDFVEHRLMDDQPADSPHGACFAELHALDLADVDGDGLPDVVSGKRWWSHGPDGDPQPGSKPEVWWFRLVRGDDGTVDFVPRLADDDSGVGVQLVTGDVDGDGLRDVVIGNKRGVFLLLQRRDEVAWDGPPTLDFETGTLRGWTATGDAFEGQPIRGDTVTARGREPSLHQGNYWIGGYEKHGDGRRGVLVSAPLRVEKPWASFLVGGGGYPWTRVEVVSAADGGVVFQSTGADHESMQRVAVDLRGLVGEEILLRIVDEGRGDWGHVNFDDFRWEDAEPRFEPPPGVPAISPIDPVEHAGLAPAEAPGAMTLQPGFRVELVAGEPDVHQPIALAVDDRGRLWVAEAFTYPRRAPGDEGADDVVVFSDEDGDGRHERRTTFLAGLNLVSGLEVGFGGAWIGAAPYLLFVPDRDGDLVPDGPPEVLLDGWGWEDTHETLNAFQWGPDGWLYGCHGVFTHSRVGAPGTPDEERVPIDAGFWRFHPLRRDFEVFAWGTSNPWGIDFDDRGQAIATACVVPHLWHVIQGARYERQAGSHFDACAYEEIETIADHLHWQGEDQWAANLRSNAWGGGHAHCGALVVLGGAFPAEWRGRVLMNNIHGNRTNVDLPVRSGSGFTASHGEDFLRANDRWFRGVALEAAPDGSVLVTDWYDQQACHLTDPTVWDRTNGRIYRVSYGPPPARPAPLLDLASLPSDRLVALQADPNDWLVRHARRILQERGPDPRSAAALWRLFDTSEEETVRLRALWALHAIDGLGGLGGRLLELLDDRHEYVQAWAVQLLLERRSVTPEVRARLEALAAETGSPVVRLYLASALQRLPVPERWELAEALLARAEDAADPNVPRVLWYGIEPLVAADPARALALAAESRIESLARHLVRRAASEPALLDAVALALGGPEPRLDVRLALEETAAALEDQRGLEASPAWEGLLAELLSSEDPTVADLAREVALALGDRAALPALRRTLADRGADADDRREALAGLLRVDDAAALPAVLGLLDERALRGAALRALEEFDDPSIPAAILGRYPELSADERRDALNTLTARAAWAGALLDAVAGGVVARTDLGAFVVRKIESLGDSDLAARVGEVWGRVRATPEEKARRIEELEAMLSTPDAPAPDRARGRAVFARTCEQCHTLFGRGGAVGPDLTGSNRADLDYLLSNVVDPNAVVGQDYLATLAWLEGGRLVTGIRRSETPSSVTLQTENELVTLARGEIEELRLSDLSTMPEGLLDALSEDEIRDLVGYLRGAGQAPLRATAADAEAFFDGETLAGWTGDAACWSVEDGAIVGRTDGLDRNEFLRSDYELGDFRLSLEVRLVGDRGNSGIQLRTRARADGEVEGLQADVGPGWWGKLYEENGRGLLAAGPAEDPVVADGWNRYEIEAIGTRVRTWINGVPCVDLEDAAIAPRGIVALQIHSGGPTEVRFRRFELELLD